MPPRLCKNIGNFAAALSLPLATFNMSPLASRSDHICTFSLTLASVPLVADSTVLHSGPPVRPLGNHPARAFL